MSQPVPPPQPYALSQRSAAEMQVLRANLPIGGGLSRFEDAEDVSLFAQPPLDDGGAYRHAAYWMAVAARLSGDGALARSAAGYLAWASPYLIVTSGTSAIAPSLRDAANQIQAVMAQHPASASEVGKVATELARVSDPKALQRAQHEDDSIVGMIRRLQQSSDTLMKLAGFAIFGLIAVVIGGGVWAWKRRKR